MATKPKPAPGVPAAPVRHRVLYMKPEATATDWIAKSSYEDGDKNGPHVFTAIRSDEINRARHRGAPHPIFLEQSEEGGIKVEEK